MRKVNVSSDFMFFAREENLLKISRRVKEYKVEILNPPREGKKLLVLDVDYTLFGKSDNNTFHFLYVIAFKIVFAALSSTKVNHLL